MKDLIARIPVRLTSRRLCEYAAPPSADGTPAWWAEFERAFRRHAARPVREQNPLQRAVTRRSRERAR